MESFKAEREFILKEPVSIQTKGKRSTIDSGI